MYTTSEAYSTIEELENLIENKVPESQRLEYKGYKFPEGRIPDADKKELIKDITAMANAEGGHIIIGIVEDGNGGASNLQDIGCDNGQSEKIILALQQAMLAKIRPRLYGVTFSAINLAPQGLVLSIHISKSINRPHAVNDGNKDEFFLRHSRGVTYMSIDDIRGQILSSHSFVSDIRKFISDRVSRILSREAFGNMDEGAILSVHIVPVWSLEPGNKIDIKHAGDNQSSFLAPLFDSGYKSRYNTEGFCTFGLNYENQKVNSFLQVFRNGIIEAVNIRLMNIRSGVIYEWERTESALLGYIEKYNMVLSPIPKPWYIYIHFLNAKGFQSSGWLTSYHPIDSNVVAAECVFNEDDTLENALKPAFNTIANALGRSQSPNYNEEGKYIRRP